MSLSQRDDSELARSSASGDQAAFAELVERYRLYVIGVAYRLGAEAELAEDIAQEVFLRVWRALPRFRGESAFRTWLYRVATNTAIELLRRRRPNAELDDEALAAGDNAEDQALRDDRVRAVRRAIAGLPEQSRLTLILREYEFLSYKEIAAALDIPLGTVMSRLSYARQCLRRDLAAYLDVEEA